MAAPVPGGDARERPDLTRLDAAVDAVTVVGSSPTSSVTAARDGLRPEIRHRSHARRAGGKAVVRAVLDVEPSPVDSDHDLAFSRGRRGQARRSMMVWNRSGRRAAAALAARAVPVLARRHAVVIASVRDPDLEMPLSTPPRTPRDVYAAAVASTCSTDAPRGDHAPCATRCDRDRGRRCFLGEACVRAYLQLKSRARL